MIWIVKKRTLAIYDSQGAHLMLFCVSQSQSGGSIYFFKMLLQMGRGKGQARQVPGVIRYFLAALPDEPLVTAMFIRLSSRLYMSDVSFSLSPRSSILLSLLTSVLLLALIRAALLFLRSWTSSSSEKQTLVHVQHQKNVEQRQSSPSISMLNWRFNIFSWQNIPALPVSFKFNEKDMNGQGVGLVPSQQLTAEHWQPGPRSGPAFEHPRTFIDLRLPSPHSVIP